MCYLLESTRPSTMFKFRGLTVPASAKLGTSDLAKDGKMIDLWQAYPSSFILVYLCLGFRTASFAGRPPGGTFAHLLLRLAF